MGELIIPADQLGQHAVRTASWAASAGRRPIGTTAQLLMELLAAGTVARLDLLDGALELARREGAAQALELAAAQLSDTHGHAHPVPWLQKRANLHRSGDL